jgi:SPP1 family predicted phage head-tail adaptor
MPEAGKMRFLAVYQEPVRATDAYNASKPVAWADKFSVPMSIETLKAWEVMKHRAVQENVTHRLKCRWRPGINPSGRFSYHGRVFDVFSIHNIDERNVEYEILANEVVKPKAGN